MHKHKVIVVMPAYNAETTVEKTVADIPDGVADEIILVDDCSRDRTVAIARELGLTVIEHESNLGYGGNQKTCYAEALERGADVVIMIHPDYQYDSRLAGHMVDFIKNGYFDIMLGSRIRTRAEALAGGMPVYKYLANRLLTITENILLGQNLSEYHTGYRAYSRRVLETIPWRQNSDDFAFDAQFLAQAIFFGFKIAEIPVPVRYMAEASSINFKRSAEYGLENLKVILQFWLHRVGLRKVPLFLPQQTTDPDA
ncbi:MAG: glycosyltransferase family 2 protein [Candidatus Lernaella stagnicola]|nr:glycosyltransferase family 2 protein [Candidatus Lernaella stagnicola]